MAMNLKPKRVWDTKEIIYDQTHWNILHRLRYKTKNILEKLKNHNIDSVVIGSVARGDVNKDSDIDIVLLNYIPTFFLENIFIGSGINIYHKTIVQATPNSVIKANIYLDKKTSISIPLSKLTDLDYDFLKFTGSLSLDEIIIDKRVPGINKTLLFIQPTNKGHIEYSIIGSEYTIAKTLRISPQIIFQKKNYYLEETKLEEQEYF